MSKRQIQQGQIYICELGENIGSEQSGERPCLIIQNNTFLLSIPLFRTFILEK